MPTCRAVLARNAIRSIRPSFSSGCTRVRKSGCTSMTMSTESSGSMRRAMAHMIPDDAGMRETPQIGAMFGAVDTSTFMGLPAATVAGATGSRGDHRRRFRHAVCGGGRVLPQRSGRHPRGRGGVCREPRAHGLRPGRPDLRRRRRHGGRLRRRRHRRGRPRRQPRPHPRRRRHAARPRRRPADARRRRLGADPDARGVRGPAAAHDPADRRAHRLARGGAGRASRPLLHHAAGVRDGARRAHHPGRPARDRLRPASATTPTRSPPASRSSRPATCTPTAWHRCWS